MAVSLALLHILPHPLLHAGHIQISFPKLDDSSILHNEPEHSLDTLHPAHPHLVPGHHLLLPYPVHQDAVHQPNIFEVPVVPKSQPPPV